MLRTTIRSRLVPQAELDQHITRAPQRATARCTECGHAIQAGETYRVERKRITCNSCLDWRYMRYGT